MPATIRIEIVSSTTGDGLDQTQRGLRDLEKSAQSAKGGVDGFREMAIGAFRAVGAAAVALASQAVGAMVKFGQDSVQAAATFEGAVNGLAAVAGTALTDAGFSLDDVSKKALQLGKDTQYSAQEAIIAMTELAKGGVPIANVMTDATDATLALAAAGGVNLAGAAEIVAKQLGMWADTGVTAANVADLIASAANASTVGVEDLALGLANVGGQARTTGVDFQDLLTGLAAIAPGFTNAGTAGTAMKTFLARLVPTTKAAKAAMAELGLTTEAGASKFFDAQGQFLGLEHAAGLLEEALGGMSAAQKSAILNTIFGQEAIAVADVLARKGAEGYREMAAAMGATGGAAEVAAAKQQGFAFAMEQFSGSMETLQIVLGTKLLPLLTPFIGQLTAGVNTVMTFAQTFFNLSGAIGQSATPMQTFVNVLAVAASSAIPGAGAAILTLWSTLQPVIASMQSLGTMIQANLTPILAGVAGLIMAVAVPAFVAWATAATAAAIATITALAPVIIPIAAITAAAALLGLAWQENWGGIQEATAGAWAVVQPILADLWTWLGATIPPIIDQLASWFTGTLLPAVSAIASYIASPLLPALSNLAQLGFVVVATKVMELGAKLNTMLRPAMDAVASFVRTNLLPALDASKPVLSGVASVAATVAGGFRGIADAIGSAIAMVHAFIEAASKIKVPPLVTPGSPTPLEMGFRGIADAVQHGASVLPTFSAALAGITPAALTRDITQSLGNTMGQSGVHLNDYVALPRGGAGAPTTTKNLNQYFTYSPTYGATPRGPVEDFHLMRSLANAGT